MIRNPAWWLLPVLAACGAPAEDDTQTDDSDDTDEVDDGVDEAPPAPTPRIRPAAPLQGEALAVVWDPVVDPDGDTIEYIVRWSTDDTRAEFTPRDQVIPAEQVRRGKTWTVQVLARANGKDSPTGEASVTVGNASPEITTVTVNPSAPQAGDALRATVSASDYEGDNLTNTWTWTVNGAQVLQGVGANTLDGADLSRGDVVVASVSVADGKGGTATGAASPVTVVNTPPAPPRVLLTPRVADADDDLTCTILVPGFDADGDALTYTYRWEKAGVVARTTATTTALSDVLVASRTEQGELWACTVSANDGLVDGDRVGEAVTIGAPAPDIYAMSLGNAFSCAMDSNGVTACWGDDLNGRAASPDDELISYGASGADFSCGLRYDGTIACWGYNGGLLGTQTKPPTGVHLLVAAAGGHACALAEDRSLACWGDNAQGASTPPAGTWRDVAVGTLHGCAIDDDGLTTCWGRNTLGQTDAPSEPLALLRARGDTTCGLRIDGTIACWGNNGLGQATPPAGGFRDLAMGVRHGCAISSSDGALACWGDDSAGQASPPPGSFERVWSGDAHTCAQDADNAVLCWGDAIGGVLELPVGVSQAVSSGSAFDCLLDDLGLVSCYGVDTLGFPIAPAPYGLFTQVEAGSDHACGVLMSGAIECWGDDSFGQSSPPTGVFSKVSVGFSHSCGLRLNGDVECWGSNDFGERNVPAGAKFTDVDLGTSHSCGLLTSGLVDCWGLNLFGQSGQVPATGTFTAVTAGGNHSCALASDGTVDCWGFNTLGQARDQNEPFQAIGAGEQHTCGVRADGSIKCWGLAVGGLLRAPDGDTFRQVTAGLTGSCALDDAGGVWCWGATRRRPL